MRFCLCAILIYSFVCLGQPRETSKLRGRVESLVVDNFQNGTSRTRIFLRTSTAVIELHGAGKVRPGRLAEVTGQMSAAGLAVSEVTPLDGTAPVCSSVGEQKVLAILASFPSKALLSSVTPGLVRASLLGAGRTLDQFVRESSFGQAWVTGDVLGPHVLDADYFDQPLAIRDAALRAAAPFADLTQYSRFIVVAPQGQSGMDSGGMALIGCGTISSPQGDLTASSIWMGAESMVGQNETVDIATHELGHGFGLEHARFADYGGDALGPAGVAPAPWDSIHEYGDSYSSMGRQSAQWASPQKALLGWFSPGAVVNVTASGNYTLTPYESAGANQVLRVARDPSGTDWLWFEYRQPSGIFDSTLPAGIFAGALVHYEDPALLATVSGVDASTYSNLVNFHPATANSQDPVLHAGETWNDPYGNLSVSISSSGPSLSVAVEYAPASICPSAVGSAQSFDATGGNGTIPVTALPSCSWSSAASVPWIALAPANSGTGNGNLSFTVAQNPDMAPRWGRITIGGVVVVVTQAGVSRGWIVLSPSSASVAASGTMAELAVATNAPDLAWETGADVDWITDIECSCFLTVGPATVRYIVAANSGPARTGHLNVGEIPFTISQDAGDIRQPLVEYRQLSPADAPSARLNQALAPFGHSGHAVLYGGGWDATLSSETWLWDGAQWGSLKPAHNPGLLASHAMAYDDARGQIVLFGGIDGNGMPSNQTWVWDGTDWTQANPQTIPPARFGQAMTYDAARQRVVLFGGYGPFGESNDTWLWNGSNWTQAASAQNPAPRTGHAMAFDQARGVVVMFGGMRGAPPVFYSDTWLWDGASWQQALPATSPTARSGLALAYDRGLDMVVMVGGTGGKDLTATSWDYDFRKETWTWDGSTWTQQFPENQPGPAYTPTAFYDELRHALTVQLGDDLTCLSRGPKSFRLLANRRLFEGFSLGRRFVDRSH